MAATYILADKKLNWISTECKEDKALHSILSSKLLKNPALKGWERLVVKTLATSPNPGRRQLEKLEAISARLNQVGGEASRLTSELKALPKGGTANG